MSMENASCMQNLNGQDCTDLKKVGTIQSSPSASINPNPIQNSQNTYSRKVKQMEVQVSVNVMFVTRYLYLKNLFSLPDNLNSPLQIFSTKNAVARHKLIHTDPLTWKKCPFCEYVIIYLLHNILMIIMLIHSAC